MIRSSSWILFLSVLPVCSSRSYTPEPGVPCRREEAPLTLSLGRRFCLCSGSCEKEHISCFNGNGELYEGSVSVSKTGRECLPWDSKLLDMRGPEKTFFVREHNKCRNPDRSFKPWCYVWKWFGIVKEYCEIPRCTDQAADLSPVKATVSQSGWQCGVREERIMKVVGGALSTVDRHPWMAAVFSQRFLCGGSLISPCWILSAAHCFPDGSKTNIRRLSVFLGKNTINETDLSREQKFRVTELIIHENFDNINAHLENDIALLKIESSDGECARESSSVKTVCIPDPELSLRDGTSCDVIGYGKDREGSWHYSQYLKEAKVDVLSHHLCSSKKYYGNMISDNMLCAGSNDWSTDSCKGDSGGPLMCTVAGRVYQFGVVSWGEGCSRQFRPGVYAKVSNYYHWILKKTGLSSLTQTSEEHI